MRTARTPSTRRKRTLGSTLGETELVKAEARGGRQRVAFAQRRIARATRNGEYRTDGITEPRVDEQRFLSGTQAVDEDDQMTFAGRRPRWAKDVGSAESHGVAQLEQQPRERKIKLETEASPVFLDKLAQALVDVERRKEWLRDGRHADEGQALGRVLVLPEVLERN